MTKLELGNDQRLVPLLPPSLFTLEVSSLGSFGLAPPQAKTFLAYSLLAFLETDTEAKVGGAVARGVVVALSRTQVRPVVVPGTTPFDPIRARCPRLAP